MQLPTRERFARWVACLLLASLCALTPGIIGLSDVEDGFLPVSSVGPAPQREKVSRGAPFALLLKVGEVEISEGISTVLMESLAGLPEGSTGYLIVQFYGSVTAAVDDRLDDMNAVLLEYIPNRAFLVALPASVVAELSSLPEVRAVVALQPGWKISPWLTEEMRSSRDPVMVSGSRASSRSAKSTRMSIDWKRGCTKERLPLMKSHDCPRIPV